MFENNNNQNLSYTANPGIQTSFFGKVMAFVGLAVLTSAAGVYITMNYWLEFFANNSALMFGLFALQLIMIFSARWWSQKTPINRVLFAAFAFTTGVTLTPLLAIVAATPAGASILMKALLASALVFTATAIVGSQTKYDLSGLRGFLFVGLIGLIIVNVLGIFFPWGSTMELVVSGFGVVLFSGFVMYDFQQLKNYPEDRYIDAALNIYLDIFNLFIYILRFMLAFSSQE